MASGVRRTAIGALLAGILVTASALLAPAGYASGPPAGSAPSVGSPAGGAAQRSNVPGLSSAQYVNSFVVRDGARMSVAGRPFHFSGANAEDLGLENYGPNPSTTIPAGSERYATRYEIDDLLATAHEMGATVIRAQTVGDTVGCALCLEPAKGRFNPRAFAELDLVVAEARRYGIKLIGEFDGDANAAPPPGEPSSAQKSPQSHDWYCAWEGISPSDCQAAFFTDPRLIADFEQHVQVLLDHVNPLTHLAYKDDPVFAGWVDGNNLGLSGNVPGSSVETWLGQVSAAYKQIDRNQLFINISLGGGDLLVTSSALAIPGVDVYAGEEYPHWLPIALGNPTTGAAAVMHLEAWSTARAGKVFAPIEYGWDHTNFTTTTALNRFLTDIEKDPNVGGDAFWNLQSHADGHGWQPIPADARCQPTCQTGEDGQWWAMYYTGWTTLSNSTADMAARAQLIRAHGYRMAGFAAVPAHEHVPAPVITSTAQGKLTFEGAAGSPSYSVQQLGSDGQWRTTCAGCATDATGTWTEPAATTGCYRLLGVNLEGIEGPASRPAGPSCQP